MLRADALELGKVVLHSHQRPPIALLQERSS
jgi:hypothetical protein